MLNGAVSWEMETAGRNRQCDASLNLGDPLAQSPKHKPRVLNTHVGVVSFLSVGPRGLTLH
jgi:hypothetical protein